MRLCVWCSGDRLDALRQCVGQETCETLVALKLFMVGDHETNDLDL